METLGSLLDKLSICNIKIEKLRESNSQTLTSVELQRNDFISQINDLLTLVISGKIPAQEPKFKFYAHENASNEKFEGLGEAASRLFQTNYTLWNLEDRRRDKNLDDSIVRSICDDIAKYNRIRNDAMDEINKILEQKIQNKGITNE